MDITDSFGYWIRRRRKALDLTQEELAQRVGCAGVTLRKIEADERRPSRLMAERLAQCLALPPSEISKFMAVVEGKRGPAHLGFISEPVENRSHGNLPAQVTSVVGRTDDLAAITACLRRKDVRLHTLTGPVGVGKTRLAIEAGSRLSREFPDGVFLVALAPIQDPALVPATTATVLGVRQARGQGLERAMISNLAHKELLLIFDNFEHLQPAASFLSTLLASAPKLRLLVTSRSNLHLYGEHEYRVTPLPLPDTEDHTEACNAASVQLFCERAQAARADFQLTPALTPVVVDICRRLDGLPLAIELAASRIKLFTPQELRQRLEHGLSFLTQDTNDLPLRLQGLESAITWSYSLLSPSERKLFSRLAVFKGGFTLQAVEKVCGIPFTERVLSSNREATFDTPDVTEGITGLLNHNLLLRQNEASESRFSMLETIRIFAHERLRAERELEGIQQRHAEYFADWVKEIESQLSGPNHATWLMRMEHELVNLRSALTWLIDNNQVEKAGRIACAMEEFGLQRGHYSEGRSWMERVLAKMTQVPTPSGLRVKSLQPAATLDYGKGTVE